MDGIVWLEKYYNCLNKNIYELKKSKEVYENIKHELIDLGINHGGNLAKVGRIFLLNVVGTFPFYRIDKNFNVWFYWKNILMYQEVYIQQILLWL